MVILKHDHSISEEKKLKLSEDVTESATAETAATSGDPPSEPEVFRCEACGATFNNLVQFMDHRNSQCESGRAFKSVFTGEEVWHKIQEHVMLHI